ncbi:hypothetical protein FW778_03600 [Ginsengibacter hankyongi]|uniref:DUF5683 domain-containing protein n=1 Tax=Ginsengibacter hankyongi TaxID=2607284 RepID=A0A5J5IML3_9BACT|nr:DUF5683 domain-containing protein [Ginsengibacter hankyongi]KAA9041134.1 hypothetical protein FW778_03600 [Ginsengibacter hankyongi]
MLKTFLLFGAFFFLFIICDTKIFAQQKEDTVILKENTSIDTTGKKVPAASVVKKKYNPKVATFRSAVLPGWGQAYNRKYWKIPIIYGALGTTAGVFFFNLKTYKRLRQAVILRSDTILSNDNQVYKDFINLSTESIRSYRNEYRQNIDYSVLFFMLFWGLNVVDATVDAHLKSFDVSPDISMKIRPGLNTANNGPGISFVFFFKNNHSKVLLPLP